MSDGSENLQNLENLARLSVQGSSEDRVALLRQVTDMFMEEPEGLSETEIQYFGDIMGAVAFKVEMKVRQHLAETIAAIGEAPPELIKQLANDSIEVARPILMQSGALKDADLVEIIARHSQDHMLAISLRTEVSEQVTDALVERGSDDVLGSLAGNVGARFSRDGMETMVERSRENESIQEGLVERTDVPKDLVERLFTYVSSALRETMLTVDNGLDPARVEELLAETKDWIAKETIEQDANEADKFIDRKDALHQLDPGLLIHLVRQGKISEFIAGLAKLTKVELNMVRQSVADKKGEKLAILCKAIDIPSDAFSEIIELVDFRRKRNRSDNTTLAHMYSMITPESAQRTLRFLRTRSSVGRKTTPRAPA